MRFGISRLQHGFDHCPLQCPTKWLPGPHHSDSCSLILIGINIDRLKQPASFFDNYNFITGITDCNCDHWVLTTLGHLGLSTADPGVTLKHPTLFIPPSVTGTLFTPGSGVKTDPDFYAGHQLSAPYCRSSEVHTDEAQ